jgi:hypothetical protein
MNEDPYELTLLREQIAALKKDLDASNRKFQRASLQTVCANRPRVGTAHGADREAIEGRPNRRGPGGVYSGTAAPLGSSRPRPHAPSRPRVEDA